MFMCSSCGYTLFPARQRFGQRLEDLRVAVAVAFFRGREGAFFNDKFKCPMCGASKAGAKAFGQSHWKMSLGPGRVR